MIEPWLLWLVGLVLLPLLLFFFRNKPQRIFIAFVLGIYLSGLRVSLDLFGQNLNVRPSHFVLAAVSLPISYQLISGKLRWKLNILDMFVIGFIVANYVSSLYNMVEIGNTGFTASSLLLTYALMYFVVGLTAKNSKLTSAELLKIFLHIGIMSIALGLVMVIGKQLGFVGDFWRGQEHVSSDFYSAVGLLQEANIFGIISACLFAIFLAFYGSLNLSSLQKWVYLAILFVGVLWSFTRSAWAMSLVVLGFSLVSRLDKGKTRRLALGGIVIAAAITFVVSAAAQFSALFDLVTTRFAELLDVSSGTGALRVRTISAALELLPHSPLIGLGPNAPLDPVFGTGWLYSSFVQTLLNTGIIGTFFLIAIYAWPILKLKNMRYSVVRRALFFSLLVVIVTSQSSSTLWLDFFWVFLGMMRGILAKLEFDNSGVAYADRY
jgi:hypothetical protein